MIRSFDRVATALRALTWLITVSALGTLPAIAVAQAASDAEVATADVELDPARAEASMRFRRGVALHTEGDYEAALIEFQRAYEAAPSYAVLYNVGQTQLAMRRYVAALRAFERYLEQGGESIDARRREEVEQQVATLRARTGYIVVRANVEGAEILIDDELVGRHPLGPIAADTGRHRVQVRAPEHQAQTRIVLLAGGDTVEWDVTLEPTQVVIVRQAVAEPSDDHPMLVTGGVGLGFTAALAIAAISTGVLAVERHGELERELAMVPADPLRIEAARDGAAMLALTTDVLAGAAILTGAVSLALVIADVTSGSGEDAGEGERRSGTSLETTLSIGPTGVLVRGRF